MTRKTLIFTKENKSEWSSLTEEFRTLQQALISFKGGFELTISEIGKDKTHLQLKGFHKLLDMLVPYFKEWTGEIWYRDNVKDFIKKRANYVTQYKGVAVTKSCKDATLEEMMLLIKEVEKFAAEMGVEDCYLKPKEQLELEKFYKTKKEKQ